MIDPVLGGNMPPVQVFEIKPTVRMPRRWQPWKFISVAMVIPWLLMHATQQPTLSKQVAPPMLRKASLPPVLHFVPMHEANWPKWRETIFYKEYDLEFSAHSGGPFSCWADHGGFDSSWHEGDANPFRLLDCTGTNFRRNAPEGTLVQHLVLYSIEPDVIRLWLCCSQSFFFHVAVLHWPISPLNHGHNVSSSCHCLWPCMTSRSYLGLLPRR